MHSDSDSSSELNLAFEDVFLPIPPSFPDRPDNPLARHLEAQVYVNGSGSAETQTQTEMQVSGSSGMKKKRRRTPYSSSPPLCKSSYIKLNVSTIKRQRQNLYDRPRTQSFNMNIEGNCFPSTPLRQSTTWGMATPTGTPQSSRTLETGGTSSVSEVKWYTSRVIICLFLTPSTPALAGFPGTPASQTSCFSLHAGRDRSSTFGSGTPPQTPPTPSYYGPSQRGGARTLSGCQTYNAKQGSQIDSSSSSSTLFLARPPDLLRRGAQALNFQQREIPSFPRGGIPSLSQRNLSAPSSLFRVKDRGRSLFEDGVRAQQRSSLDDSNEGSSNNTQARAISPLREGIKNFVLN
eukprot:g3474.t1